ELGLLQLACATNRTFGTQPISRTCRKLMFAAHRGQPERAAEPSSSLAATVSSPSANAPIRGAQVCGIWLFLRWSSAAPATTGATFARLRIVAGRLLDPGGELLRMAKSPLEKIGDHEIIAVLIELAIQNRPRQA